MSSFIWSKYEFSISTNLEIIQIPETSYSKIHNHEISIDGVMYDIKEIKKTTQGYKLIVFKDTRETQILKFISKSKDQKLEISFLNFLALLITGEKSNFEYNIAYMKEIKQYAIYSIFCTNHLNSIFAPPPNIYLNQV